MQVFHKLQETAPKVEAASVAIGNFDGVHLGHAALLRHMLEHAHSVSVPGTVLTFFPHPVEVLNPKKKLERLTTTSEKLALFEAMGVDLVLVEPFDMRLAALSPEEFFDRFLVQGLKAKSIHVGYDFNFGKARAGNTQVLEELARRHGIQLRVEPPLLVNGVKVGSSAIRQFIREGDVVSAAAFLGRPYSLSGLVSHGDQRGTGLGFPTANLRFSAEKVLPKNGVYVTRAVWQKQIYRSVTNVGLRPTFQTGRTEELKLTVEVHILDFNTKVYDEFLQLEFLERIRDEKKFESADALKKQIHADVDYARSSKFF